MSENTSSLGHWTPENPCPVACLNGGGLVINRDRMTTEFLEMVKIDSISGQERKIADLIILKLKNLGFQVIEDTAGKRLNTDTGNIIAKIPGNVDGSPAIMICAHMDTVEPGKNIIPVVEQGIIRSSGDTVLGGDNKAGIAIILEAIRVIRDEQIKHGDLELVLTVFEEGGLFGARNLDMKMIEAKIGYVLDSDGPPGTIVNRAPTQDRISVTVKGKAAHAGICPERGINAIEVASRAIAGMNLGRIDEETTANIGIISGGKATNIIPESVFIQGETRSLNKTKKDSQTKMMADKFYEAAAGSGALVDVKVKNLYNSFSIGKDEEVVRLAMLAASNLNLKTKVESTGGGSDANVFNERGISTVILGINMQNVHTTDEFIKIEDMENGCRYLLEIIKVAAKSPQ